MFRRLITRYASQILQCIVVLSVLAAASTVGSAQDTETLGSVKQKYLNQTVVLIGYVTDKLATQPVLMEWHPARLPPMSQALDGRYDYDISTYLPATYKGKSATVIAIQLNKSGKQGTVNALGELVSADDAVDPYFDFVVKFDDGQVALVTAYPSTISDDVKFASTQNALTQEMAAKLPGVVGRTFYGCFYTRLYSPDATLDELQSYSDSKAIDFPFLVPLKVTVAKFDEAATTVILRVKLPDGTDALTFAGGNDLTEKGKPFIERISGTMLSEIPKKFTPREITTIKKETLFRGMSRDAAYCSQGFPHSVNDWGTGGKQLIYTDGLMVYLDNQNSVVDWQLLGNN